MPGRMLLSTGFSLHILLLAAAAPCKLALQGCAGLSVFSLPRALASVTSNADIGVVTLQDVFDAATVAEAAAASRRSNSAPSFLQLEDTNKLAALPSSWFSDDMSLSSEQLGVLTSIAGKRMGPSALDHIDSLDAESRQDQPMSGFSLVQKPPKAPTIATSILRAKLSTPHSKSLAAHDAEDLVSARGTASQLNGSFVPTVIPAANNDISGEVQAVALSNMGSNVSTLSRVVPENLNLSHRSEFTDELAKPETPFSPKSLEQGSVLDDRPRVGGENASIFSNSSSSRRSSSSATPQEATQEAESLVSSLQAGSSDQSSSIGLLRKHVSGDADLPSSPNMSTEPSVDMNDDIATSMVLLAQNSRQSFAKSLHMALDLMSPSVIIIVFVAGVLVLCILVFRIDKRLVGFFHPVSKDDARDSGFRSWVESLPILRGEDIESYLLSHAAIDGESVRVEGRILPRQHSPLLKAPMAQRNCLVFSASAAEIRLDGVSAPPVAFHAMRADFDLEPTNAGAQQVQIRIQGHHVALFDMSESSSKCEHWTWEDAPEHLQDFVRTHRSTTNAGESPLITSTVLEFKESSLDADATVTVVGELRRAATGELQLWPTAKSPIWSPTASERSGRDRTFSGGSTGSEGLTSWERPEVDDSHSGKVMISDDPCLLASHREAKSSELFACLAPRSGHHQPEATTREASGEDVLPR